MSSRNVKAKGKSSRQTPKRTDQQPNTAGIGQANKTKIAKIKQITNWTVDEDILAILRDSNGDVTLAVEKILSGDAGRPGEEWTEVSRKKPKESPNTGPTDGGEVADQQRTNPPRSKPETRGVSTRTKANGENIRVKEARRRSEPRSPVQSGRRGGSERQPNKRAPGTEARSGGGSRPRPPSQGQQGRGVAPQGRHPAQQQPQQQQAPHGVRRIPPEGLARGPGGLSQAAHLAQLQAQAHPRTSLPSSTLAPNPKAEPQPQDVRQGVLSTPTGKDGLLPQPQTGLAQVAQTQMSTTAPQQQQQQQTPAQAAQTSSPQIQSPTHPATQAQPQSQPQLAQTTSQSPKAHTPKSGSRRGGEQRVWMPRDSSGATPVRTPPAQARTSQSEQGALFTPPISSITGPIPAESAQQQQQRAVVILPDDEFDPEREERVFAWQFGNFAIKENGSEAPQRQTTQTTQTTTTTTTTNAAVSRPMAARQQDKEVETPVATAPVTASQMSSTSAPVATTASSSVPTSSSPPSRATTAAAAAASSREDKKPSPVAVAPMQQQQQHQQQQHQQQQQHPQQHQQRTALPPHAAQLPPAMDAEQQHMATMGHQNSGYYTGHFAHPSFHPAMSPSGFPLDIDPSHQMSFYDPSQYQSAGAYRSGSPQHMGSESTTKYGGMQGSQGSGYREKYNQSQQASVQDRQDDTSPPPRGQQPQSQSPPPVHQQPHLYAMQTSQYPQPMYGYPPYMGYPAASSPQFPPFQRFPMHYKYTNSAGYPISPPGSASLNSGGYPDEQEYAKYVSQPHVPSFFGVTEATAPAHMSMGKTHTPPTSSGTTASTHPGASKPQSGYPSSGASNGSDPYKGQDYGASQQYYKYNAQAYGQQYGQPAQYQGGSQFGFMPQHMMQTQQPQGQQNPSGSGSQGSYS